jgi:hypothetical protein
MSGVKIVASVEDLNEITNASGFDWLYDYNYRTSRQMTLKHFIENTSEDEAPVWYENFCKDLKKEIALDTLIMFEPS